MTPTPTFDDLVSNLRSIDDHTHVLPLGTEEVDLDSPINPYEGAHGYRMRPTNPEYVGAWKALWGYKHEDFEPDHLVELINQKLEAQRQPGYYDWMLDKLNCDALFYVAPAPFEEFPKATYHWMAHTDWMLWPFEDPDEPDRVFVPTYIELNRQHRAAVGADEVHETVAEYVAEMVEGHLRQFRANGAIAIKFNIAYYRPIEFNDVSSDRAEAIYTKLRQGDEVARVDRLALQDFLFRSIVRAAGENQLPVQIHTGLGARPHFIIQNSNPLLLETVFRDVPETKFLMLHGGWPYEREAVSALAHENVYLDFSVADLYFYPRALAELIRAGLEWFPEKIIFGTDAHSERSIAKLSGVPPRPNPLAGWEEKFWRADQTSRQALTRALNGMAADGQIDEDRGAELAHRVMRGNSQRLYGLDDTGRQEVSS